ncbi:hypothetical protein TOL_3071 [Thalassolituus oleivorans MIL-1]|uniref:Uncharacterized protein n=1 Tax=Thalassolituus oleivorans MIL-1 TaxID=1298593 RepID=M5DVM7_9GAMM|nr:hypothetical protein TOL_3071 [Thalassolituus oleivorans MIL-1]
MRIFRVEGIDFFGNAYKILNKKGPERAFLFVSITFSRMRQLILLKRLV